MIAFFSGVAATLAAQAAWKYRANMRELWEKIKAKRSSP